MAYGFAKIATAAFTVSVGNVKDNVKSVIELINKAESRENDVIVFPELTLTGYTCGDLFLQSYLDKDVLDGLEQILEQTDGKILSVIGMPLRKDGMLFNCAVLIQHKKILVVVPKTFIPNYGEFYEKRWFVPASCRLTDQIELPGGTYPFTPDLIVQTRNGLKVACEICEDLWVNMPPSSMHTLYGANLIVNPSASNEVITKSNYRRNLVSMQSARCICAYAYASAGAGESTTDLVFSGQHMIAVNGSIVAEQKENTGLLEAIVDIEKLENDRIKFNSTAYEVPRKQYTILATPENKQSTRILPDSINPYPFVPSEEKKRDERCKEILHLQAAGLTERIQKTGIQKLVIGISGGLDSTLALLVAIEACDRLKMPHANIIGITMPGFGTTKLTKGNSDILMERLGIDARTIDIKAACSQHMKDIDHSENTYDVTFENVQARERTQILMDVANQEGALVVGTGDLSELALGWCTYNGDHMSMYAVNVSIPKTLVKYLVSTYAMLHEEVREVLDSICNTLISPELLPPDKNGEIRQSTESTIGKYDLHDFFLYHFIRNGFSKEKIQILAQIAFPDVKTDEIKNTLDLFYKRFYGQQFKRSCLPDGPKIGTVSLSPRGDWRMPSDVCYRRI